MSIVTIIKLFLSLADQLAKYASDRQLLKAGEGQALAAQLAETQKRILAAVAAAAAVTDDPNSVRNDPNNRDK